MKKEYQICASDIVCKKPNVMECNCNTQTEENEGTKIVIHGVGNGFHSRDSIHNGEIDDVTAFETASGDNASVLIWILGLFDQ